MNWGTFGQFIGYLGAILIPLAFLPQIIKSFKTKNTQHISLFSYLIYGFGITFLLLFAIINSDFILLTCEILCIIEATAMIYLIINNRKKPEKLVSEVKYGRF